MGGLNDGTIAFVASDHALIRRKKKAQDIWSAPAGMVTVETMVPVIIDAVKPGKKISWNKLAEGYQRLRQRCSVFILPRILEVGTDADISIVDPIWNI